MKELVNVCVVEVFVDNAVNAHKVLDKSVANWVCRFDLLVTVIPICHLECKFAQSIDALGAGLVILV